MLTVGEEVKYRAFHVGEYLAKVTHVWPDGARADIDVDTRVDPQAAGLVPFAKTLHLRAVRICTEPGQRACIVSKES